MSATGETSKPAETIADARTRLQEEDLSGEAMVFETLCEYVEIFEDGAANIYDALREDGENALNGSRRGLQLVGAMRRTHLLRHFVELDASHLLKGDRLLFANAKQDFDYGNPMNNPRTVFGIDGRITQDAIADQMRSDQAEKQRVEAIKRDNRVTRLSRVYEEELLDAIKRGYEDNRRSLGYTIKIDMKNSAKASEKSDAVDKALGRLVEEKFSAEIIEKGYTENPKELRLRIYISWL